MPVGQEPVPQGTELALLPPTQVVMQIPAVRSRKPTPSPVRMYQKPALEKFGTFRDLTQWGFASASDGGSIFGISSNGCSTRIGRRTLNIGCPTSGGSPGQGPVRTSS